MTAADVAGEVHDQLVDAKIDHCFGGGLALNYYAPPRLTTDVDVNVAVPVVRSTEVIDLFAGRGFDDVEPQGAARAPVAGIRMTRGRDVIDLFLAFDDYHQRVVERAVTFPFSTGDRIIDLPFLSADDLVVMKLSFNRPKDWVDSESMLEAGTPIDAQYVDSELLAFRGPTMHPRLAVFRQRAELVADRRRRQETPPSTLRDQTSAHVARRRPWSSDGHVRRQGAIAVDDIWVTSRQGFRSHQIAYETEAAIIARCGQQLAARHAVRSADPTGAPCPRCT